MYFDRGNDMTLLPSVIEYSVPSMFYTAAVSFSFNAELLTAENYIFILLSFAVRELDVPGNIYERKTYPFEFPTVEMPYETYNGVNVRLRYHILEDACFPVKVFFMCFCSLSGI
jgi:hypothetical protein